MWFEISACSSATYVRHMPIRNVMISKICLRISNIFLSLFSANEDKNTEIITRGFPIRSADTGALRRLKFGQRPILSSRLFRIRPDSTGGERFCGNDSRGAQCRRRRAELKSRRLLCRSDRNIPPRRQIQLR